MHSQRQQQQQQQQRRPRRQREQLQRPPQHQWFCVILSLLFFHSLVSAEHRSLRQRPQERGNRHPRHRHNRNRHDNSTLIEDTKSNTTPRPDATAATDEEITPRIIGGIPAQAMEFPFMVQGKYGCGASLIWKDIVLSAAHCQGYFDGGLLVGAVQAQSDQVGGAEWHDLAKQVIHPNYKGQNAAKGQVAPDFDIMILVLTEPVSNPALVPVKLNRNNAFPPTGEVLTVMGFGTTSETGAGSDKLLKVNINAIDMATCKDVYGGNVVDSSSMLCAGVMAGGKDSCYGDSGGPLIDQSSGVQVGVVSFGDGCARKGVPGVYARVSGCIDWIDQQICSLSSDPPDWCNSASKNGPATDSTTSTAAKPTKPPTSAPTESPTSEPTDEPTSSPTNKPTNNPTPRPTKRPTKPKRTPSPTTLVTPIPTATDTEEPTSSAPLKTNPLFPNFPTENGRNKTHSDSTDKLGVVIEVQYDEYPWETAWTLRNVETGELYHQQPMGTVTKNATVLRKGFWVQAGTVLRFEMTDTYGDGICCTHGQGYFSIYVSGELVVHDCVFQYQHIVKDFTVEYPSLNNTATAIDNAKNDNSNGITDEDEGSEILTETTTANATTIYTVEFQYDNFPLETKWYIENTKTKKIVMFYAFGSVDQPSAFLRQQVNLTAGATYNLVLRDSVGDGICCGHLNGDGYVRVYASQQEDEGEVLLVESDGTYGAGVSISFSVPETIAQPIRDNLEDED